MIKLKSTFKWKQCCSVGEMCISRVQVCPLPLPKPPLHWASPLFLHCSSFPSLPPPLSQLHLLDLSCHYLSPLLIRLCNWIFSIALSAGLDESPLKTTEIFLLTVERYCWKKEMLRITKLNRSFLPVNGDGSSDFSLCFQQALVSLTPWNLSKPFQQHFWDTKMCRSQEKAQNGPLKGPSTEK